MDRAYRERQLIALNLLTRLRQQPLVTALLGVFGLAMSLLIGVMFGQLRTGTKSITRATSVEQARSHPETSGWRT